MMAVWRRGFGGPGEVLDSAFQRGETLLGRTYAFVLHAMPVRRRHAVDDPVEIANGLFERGDPALVNR